MELFFKIGVYTASHIRCKPKLELLSTYKPPHSSFHSTHIAVNMLAAAAILPTQTICHLHPFCLKEGRKKLQFFLDEDN
jgi:hypothetical protein